MKKAKGKMRIGLRGRQKISTRTIILCGTSSIIILFLITVFFNLSNVSKIKAREIDIRQSDEQVFKNDMALPAPVINNEKSTGPNTIFIKRIKPIHTPPTLNHE